MLLTVVLAAGCGGNGNGGAVSSVPLPSESLTVNPRETASVSSAVPSDTEVPAESEAYPSESAEPPLVSDPPVTDPVDTAPAVSETVREVGLYVPATMAEMAALRPTEKTAVVLLQGYYAPGDGGGGTFYYHADATQQADGGIVIACQTGGRFVRSADESYVNVKWFGAKGDGKADDTKAIQAAIDSLPDGGGTVYLPAGTFAISSTIRIGDGDAGKKVSTKTGVKLIGAGGGFAHDMRASTCLIATKTMDSMIYVAGRISDCEIGGIYLGGNNKAKTCLYLHAFSGCYFHNLMAIGFTDVGIKVMAGTAPTGNYNIYNRFESIGVFALYDQTTCILFDGDYSVSNDTWLTVITDCRFDTAQSEHSVAAHFKFVDSISFYRCHFNTYKSSSVGAVFDALDNNDFPCGMAFYDCSLTSHEVWEDSTHKIRKQYFYGFGTYDNETVPTHKKLIGITDTGIPFNMDDLAGYVSSSLGTFDLPALNGLCETDVSAGVATHHNLKEGNTVAVLVNAAGTLKGGSFYCSSYSNNIGTITFDVYRWQTDYATTVKGKVLASASVTDFQDNSLCDVSFDGLGSGYYLVVVSGTSPAGDHGVAVWTRGAVTATTTFVNGSRVKAGLRGTLWIE